MKKLVLIMLTCAMSTTFAAPGSMIGSRKVVAAVNVDGTKTDDEEVNQCGGCGPQDKMAAVWGMFCGCKGLPVLAASLAAVGIAAAIINTREPVDRGVGHQ